MAQTVLIQSHKLTSGTSCTCFHQKQRIPFPSNATLMPKPSKFKIIEPGDVSAELFTPHRRCSHVASLLPQSHFCDTPGLSLAVGTNERLELRSRQLVWMIVHEFIRNVYGVSHCLQLLHQGIGHEEETLNTLPSVGLDFHIIHDAPGNIALQARVSACMDRSS